MKWVVTEKSELSVFRKTANYFQNFTSYIILASSHEPRRLPPPPDLATTTASGSALLTKQASTPYIY
jgi:hypothetical protein